MQIKFLESNELESLYTFNKYIYPNRTNYRSVLDFWLSKNTQDLNLSIILKGDKSEVLGQMLHSSANYYYKNETKRGEWAFDLIVDEDLRKEGYGIDILKFAMDNKDAIFAVGSGPMALKIELKMGFKLIGELRKYVGVVYPFFIFSSFFRGIIPYRNFPKSVKSKDLFFELISTNQLPDFNKPFNSTLLELCRDNDYLKWRFSSKNIHEYAFYKQENDNNYFVVRTIVRKGITCLVLVDYRVDFSDIEKLSVLFNAVKKVAFKLKISVVIIGSSLKQVDVFLERKKFKSIGRPRPIISTRRFSEEIEKIKKRDFVFLTLADSDGEITW